MNAAPISTSSTMPFFMTLFRRVSCFAPQQYPISGATPWLKPTVTCLAFSTPENREALLNNAAFLRMIAESLARIVETLTVKNAAQPSLRERLYAYMVYKCECGRLKGVEKAAFHLHCSPRQLQRILNELVRDGVARKTGKGAYELCPGATETKYDG